MTRCLKHLLAAPVCCVVFGCSATAITQSAVTSASISPPSGTIIRCVSVTLRLTLSDAAGATVAPDSVLWSSSDAAAATVSSAGVVRALSETPGVTIRGTGYARRASATAQTIFAVASSGSSAPCP